MPLPKIDIVTFELTLPSNNQTIKFRPFLVKEEKILLIATESKDPNQIVLALNQVIKNCLLDKVDVDSLPSFDAEYIFLKLREKSIGEDIQISVLDEEVNKRFDSQIDLNSVKIVKSPTHNKKIKVSDKMFIEMKYPTLKTVLTLDSKKSQAENGLKILTGCIDKIYDGESVYDVKDYSKQELQDFVESLTQGMYSKLNVFFETMPALKYESEAISPYTNKPIKISLENFIDFFV
jgi:hypothetical protein